MKLDKKYTYLWILWILAFVGIEFAAIKNMKEGDTLSEHAWKVMGKRGYKKTSVSALWRIGIGGLLVWLIVHFFGGA